MLPWLYLIVVGILWGCTNPLMKLGSTGLVTRQKHPNAIVNFFQEMYFLLTRWKYVLPLVVNLSGSVVFYWTLSAIDLSLVVPITNSLTFLFTTVTASLLGEEKVTLRTLFGMLLVVAGVAVCVRSKA